MNSRKIGLILLILLSAVVLFFAISKKAPLPQASPLPLPSASSYNPPKQIQYDSSTDLKQELENINPQVSDSDFELL